jgi:riboflavin kinase/FMN adenylyltransferase
MNGEKYMGAASIGWNPTIADKGFSIEVYIFDFEEDIYNTDLELELVQFLRQERKFDSLDELSARIHRDVEEAKQLLTSA